MTRTITDWTQHLRVLYGDRNECHFPGGLSARIAFLHLGRHKLGLAIRKGKTSEIPGALARIVARTIAVTQHFRDLPLAEALTSKYANGCCSYCQQSACICAQEARPAPKLRRARDMVHSLTFQDLCRLLNATYGAKNREEGVWWILERLNEEINELGTLEYNLQTRPLTPQHMRRQFALEAADVLAWTIALANFYSIDLEAALMARYGSVCWHCHKCPCRCLLNTRRHASRPR